MEKLDHRTFEKPDESRLFEGHGYTELVTIGGRSVARGTYEPGWRWSENIKPIAGTESCEVAHFGYVLSGHMRVTMNDGETMEVEPGDVFTVQPGHDAEVIGDENCVLVDFGDIATYARRT